jgi:AcrR family transcriptional regulator
MAMPALLARRRERASDATRSRLFRAALDEFRRAGVAGAQVARIARRARVSRPSFYFHFPTKEHVLLELQWTLELEIVERLKRCRGVREALRGFVDGLEEAERKVGSPELFRDMLAVYARRPEGVALDEQAFPTVAELTRHFAEGAARGELRPGLEPAHAARVCLASAFGILTGIAAPPAARRADFELLVSLFLAEEVR